MIMKETRASRLRFAGFLGTVAAVAALAPCQSVWAQGKMPMASTAKGSQPLPTSVLLFPAVIMGANNAPMPMSAMSRDAQEIITDAVRKYLNKGGVGVVVYNRRLPSIQRAISEGLKPEEALAGPGDDPRKAQRFADILGANEYLTLTVDDYKYDEKTRSATFNLSIARNDTMTGSGLGAVAEKAAGISPEDVSRPRQESSAIASASELVAEQTVQNLYPQTAVMINPPKVDPKAKKMKK